MSDGPRGIWKPRAEAAVERLKCASIESVVPWSADWMPKTSTSAKDPRDVDGEFIDQPIAEPTRTKVRNLLRDPNRVLLVPQALMLHE
jgi:hypothetical protein